MPDDAAFGVNKVWAEQGHARTKPFEVMVYQVTQRQLVDNFDAIVSRYLKEIPSNPYGYTSGSRYNAALTRGDLSGGMLGMTDTSFACGGYQSAVLKFLEKIRFDHDAENRAQMDGLDYVPTANHKLADDLTRWTHSYSQPRKALAVHSPVLLKITDPRGKQLVTRDDGSSQNAIEDAVAFSTAENNGGYAWVVALPQGRMQVEIVGTGAGSYQLATQNRGQPPHEYPEVPVTAGATSHITLDDQPKTAPLRTADGKELLPVERPLPCYESRSSCPGKRPPHRLEPVSYRLPRSNRVHRWRNALRPPGIIIYPDAAIPRRLQNLNQLHPAWWRRGAPR